MTTITRRAALGALASIPDIGAATEAFPSTGSTTPETIDDRIRRLAGELSAAMEGMHGGAWRVTVDHSAGFALIVQQRGVQS
ncbi:hypothetical protein D3227_35055 [Mesorhizobium waimense]|uniref:Uncharacterized protein n=1 Tax=Mesorhizobium waimense TaxID=1300307 RepID=A0A3A5JYN2_9HYPH|nr:hypothetical protein [Mesorhizobium waimense]RJT28116.1 hypothetical protein D3227_35055 [Mesorhizobium waimense]